MACSPFDARRNKEVPVTPALFDAAEWELRQHEALGAAGNKEEIQQLFPNCYGKPRVTFQPAAASASASNKANQPLRVGCVLSGGQAPGGHNVIAGLFDYVKKRNPESELIGFLDGPHGIFTGNYIKIDSARIDVYRNTGGFDLLSSGRHKIETTEQFEQSLAVCTELNLDGLVRACVLLFRRIFVCSVRLDQICGFDLMRCDLVNITSTHPHCARLRPPRTAGRDWRRRFQHQRVPLGRVLCGQEEQVLCGGSAQDD